MVQSVCSISLGRLLATCVLGAQLVLSTPENVNVVDLGYSKYQGFLDSKTKNTHFYGIRYAHPPLDSFRFKAPQPPLKTQEVIQADTQGPMCMQSWLGSAPSTPFRNTSASLVRESSHSLARRDTPSSEDCLFLDVYLPGKLIATKKLPVIVWIHGGGYILGGNRDVPELGQGATRGDDLIRAATGGVVVVIIQYRLGLFGFLAGQQVKEKGALNAGLLDQDYALQWVQRHIHKFGGDKDRVTIWGVSAGAGSVIQHLVANDGKTSPPLFRAGITSSSFLPSQYPYNHRIPESLYTDVVQRANCNNASDSFICLQNADVNVLEAVNRAINAEGFFGTFVFVPVVDGKFITQRPTKAFKQGKFNGRALHTVTNVNEGSNFIDPNTTDAVDVKNYIRNLFPLLEDKRVEVAARLYSNVGTPSVQVAAIMGESIFVCPTYLMIPKFQSSTPYKAEFAVPPALHGDDFQYYFPSVILGGGTPAFNNEAFITAFADSFEAFATTLNPNNKINKTSISPSWAPWTVNNPVEMVFNRTESGEAHIHPSLTSPELLKRCAFWDSISGQTNQ